MKGWIKIHRQITENKFWFSERFTKAQAWIDLLILANHKQKPETFFIRGNEINLERGQLGYAIKTLAKRWKWNERTVDKFLLMLQKDEMIQYRKSPITTIITIKNYDSYQDYTEQNTEQSKNRVQTNKNDKNEKNIKRIPKNTFRIETKPPNMNGTLFYENSFFFVSTDLVKELLNKFQDKGLSESILKNEFYKMEAWLEDHGKKKNYKSFIINWLSNYKAGSQNNYRENISADNRHFNTDPYGGLKREQ